VRDCGIDPARVTALKAREDARFSREHPRCRAFGAAIVYDIKQKTSMSPQLI